MKACLVSAIASALSLIASAAPITLLNPDFQGSGNGSNPADWTTVEGAAGHIYIYASGGGIPASTNVLAFHARPGNSIQQGFLTSEATADSFGTYTVSFDSGWRNNTAAPNDLSLEVALVNLTDDTVLASDTYTFPPDTPSNAFDSYRVIEVGNRLTLSYDNTDLGLVGDEIGIRFTTVTTQDTFNPTAWIDNITVDSGAPDPVLTVGTLPVIVSDGSTTTFSIPFTNDGATQDLLLSDVTLDGPDAVDFTVTGFSTPVTPGGSGSIDLSFTPTIGGGIYSFDVIIDSNSTLNPTRTLSLSAEVRDPAADFSTDTVDFGSLGVDPGPTTATVTVTNTGASEDLTIFSATLLGSAGDFTVSSIPGPIAPGTSGDVEVTFDPATGATGRFGDLLVIETDAAFNPSLTLPVTATVTAGAALPTPLTVINGDFDANPYTSAASTTPDGWTSSIVGSPGNYGQTDPATPNLTSIAAHFQARGGNYIQQDLSTGNGGLSADQITAIEVGLDQGYRNDATTNGDILMRLSLWDLVADTEIVAREFLILDEGVVAGAAANQLDTASFVLPVSSTSTSPVALRIAHIHPGAAASFTATAIIDNVTLALSGSYVPSDTPFETWALANGLDGTPGKEDGPTDDPDADGVSNLDEFAFGSDPLDAASRGLVALATADTDADTEPELLLTLAVRSGATFAGSPTPSATVDGLLYEVEGSLDLSDFTATVEGPLASPVIPTGLPATPPTGYEYQTFRLAGSNGLPSRGFLRARATEAP